MLTAHQMAEHIHNRIKGAPWLVSIGVGANDTIYVYVTGREKDAETCATNELYPVVVVKTRRFVPARNANA